MRLRVEAVIKSVLGKQRGPIDLDIEVKDVRRGKQTSIRPTPYGMHPYEIEFVLTVEGQDVVLVLEDPEDMERLYRNYFQALKGEKLS